MATSRKLVTLFRAVLIVSGITCMFFYVRVDLMQNRNRNAERGYHLRGTIRSATTNQDGLLKVVVHRTPESLMASNTSVNLSSSTHNTGLSNATVALNNSANLTNIPIDKTRHVSSPTQSVQISGFSNKSTKLDNSSSTKANDTSLHPSEALQSVITSDPRKPMICHHFSPGRLGNHLFEYASIIGLARTTNRSFFFPDTGLLLKNLKYPPMQNRTSAQLKARCKSAKKKKERYLCRYDNQLLDLEKGKDYNLFNYFQSWMYFDGIQEEIRQAVTFTDEIVRKATVVISRLKTAYPNTTFVGIHNRRGDLAENKGLTRMGYMTAPPQFFKKSMTYFRERFPRVLFIVLGEDRQWSSENIHPVNDDVIFLQPTSSPAVDMQLLSMTDHMIRTVGTFGWWAAFKIPGRPTIVYLKDFVKKGSPLSTLYSANAQDYMLPNWIAM